MNITLDSNANNLVVECELSQSALQTSAFVTIKSHIFQDLVRTRRYVKKFMLMRANIQAVSLKIQTLKSQNAMAQAMKGVTKAMQTMNKQMKLPEIQKIMMEFEKQTEIMDMKEEMMSDVIDDAMGDEDDEEESDAIVTQVLDELGLQLTDNLAAVPGAPVGK